MLWNRLFTLFSVLAMVTVCGCGDETGGNDTGSLLDIGNYEVVGQDVVDASTEPAGRLEVRLTVGTAGQDSISRSVKRTLQTSLPIVDLKNILYEIAFTQDDVGEGLSTDVTWHTIYQGSQEKYQTELEINGQIPVGTYKALRLVMSEYLIWICAFDGGTIELDDTNADGKSGQIVNVFAAGGLFEEDNGTFSLVTNSERIGSTFEVRDLETTRITIRSNFNTLDWDDADDSNDWSAGDSLSNWTTIPGTDTMADFFIEYE